MALLRRHRWYREFDAHEPLPREFAAESGVTIVDLSVLLEDFGPRKAELFPTSCTRMPRGIAQSGRR